MLMIVTADMDLARELVAAARIPSSLLLQSEPLETAVENDFMSRADIGQRWFRRRVYQTQPTVILLDAQFGGNIYRAVSSVPKIIETKSRPAVHLVVPFEREGTRSAAQQLGCADIICRASLDFSRLVRDAVSRSLRGQASSLHLPVASALLQ
jgi:hypothetical protein